MTEREMLERDIAGLKESIRLNGMDLQRLQLSRAERAGILENSRLLAQDLTDLIQRLERLDDA